MKTLFVINITHPDEMSPNELILNSFEPTIEYINEAKDWSAELISGSDFDDRALRTAIELTLSDFPSDWTTQQIMEALVASDNLYENENIIVWEPFEDWTGISLANHIEGTAIAIKNAFK